MKTYSQIGATSALVLGLVVVGCGGGKDDVSVAPPSAPPAPVTMDATAPTDPAVPAPGAPAVQPPPGDAAAAAPAAQDPGTVDKFKGMSQRDIDDFKATATPETHDMNMGPIMEAITGFQAEFRRYPANIEELVKSRYLAKVLYAPKGKKYIINPKTGEVTTD